MTTSRILDKLSKLRAAAEGEAALGNAAAAEAFASTINRMLLQHELSMEDIPQSGVNDEPIVELICRPQGARHSVRPQPRRLAMTTA